MNSFLDELKSRGLIDNCTDISLLNSLLESTGRFYIGFDCTAPSLHIGSLIPITIMQIAVTHGIQPICLLGTSTTQIGDPTGKTSTRPVIPIDKIVDNRYQISSLISRLCPNALIIDNEWHSDISFQEMINDTFSRLSLSEFLSSSTISTRISSSSHMSLAEFCYPVFQAFDFLTIASRHECPIQIGGSDQWFNITQGVSLCKKHSIPAVGLTFPLLTDASGKKFGKSERNPVWLDTLYTSANDFWHFWRNIPDNSVEQLFQYFTDIDPADIPVPDRAETLADYMLEKIHSNSNRTITFTQPIKLISLISQLNSSWSNNHIKRLLSSNSVKINDISVTDPDKVIVHSCSLRIGKRKFILIFDYSDLPPASTVRSPTSSAPSSLDSEPDNDNNIPYPPSHQKTA